MFIRFTPKQLQKTKELLKTSKLHGYDVKLYQEIIKALNDPIDEKEFHRNIIASQQCETGPGRLEKTQMSAPKKSAPSEFREELVPPLETPIEEQRVYVGEEQTKQIDPTTPTQYIPEEPVAPQNIVESEGQAETQQEYVEEPGPSFQGLKDKLSAKQAFTSPVEQNNEQPIPPAPPSPDIIDDPVPTSDQLEEAGMFGVIDNRTIKE